MVVGAIYIRIRHLAQGNGLAERPQWRRVLEDSAPTLPPRQGTRWGQRPEFISLSSWRKLLISMRVRYRLECLILPKGEFGVQKNQWSNVENQTNCRSLWWRYSWFLKGVIQGFIRISYLPQSRCENPTVSRRRLSWKQRLTGTIIKFSKEVLFLESVQLTSWDEVQRLPSTLPVSSLIWSLTSKIELSRLQVLDVMSRIAVASVQRENRHAATLYQTKAWIAVTSWHDLLVPQQCRVLPYCA